MIGLANNKRASYTKNFTFSVTLSTPSGAIIDLKVESIDQDNRVVLGPVSEKTFKSLAHFDHLKIGDVVVLGGSNFSNAQLQVRQDDLVTVTDKSGHQTQLKIYLLYDRDYLVLVRPGAPKLGTFDMLKFGWKLFWR